MLTPCNPCVCLGAPCEQCMFGYASNEMNHKRMKRLIELIDKGEKPNGYVIVERYKKYHSNWKSQMDCYLEGEIR